MTSVTILSLSSVALLFPKFLPTDAPTRAAVPTASALRAMRPVILREKKVFKNQFKKSLTSAAVRAITGATTATVIVASRLGTRAARTTRPVTLTINRFLLFLIIHIC